MSDFEPSSRLRAVAADPHKRVNYTLGMVLGVDDFVQESAWHAEARHHALRDLVGYGTVRGLAVTTRVGPSGLEAVVAPGVAVTPRGEVVRVPTEQCAVLNDWLRSGGLVAPTAITRHQEDIARAVQAGVVTLYAVLDYASCTTDPRPIPGEPCRSEDDVLVDSRIRDSFSLSLRLRPPQTIELEAFGDLIDWLRAVPVAEASPTGSGLDDFLQALRDAADGGSPLGSAYLAPPPVGLTIPSGEVVRWWRAALRFYVTVLRARQAWLAPGQDATGRAPDRTDDPPAGVLLAALRVAVVQDVIAGTPWVLAAAPIAPATNVVEVDDEARPFLLPSDFLEETLLRLGGATGGALAGGPALVASGAAMILASATAPAAALAPGALQVRSLNLNGEVEVRGGGATPGARHVVNVVPIRDASAADDVTVFLTEPAAPLGTSGMVSFRFAVRVAGAIPTEAVLTTLRVQVDITAWPA